MASSRVVTKLDPKGIQADSVEVAAVIERGRWRSDTLVKQRSSKGQAKVLSQINLIFNQNDSQTIRVLLASKARAIR